MHLVAAFEQGAVTGQAPDTEAMMEEIVEYLGECNLLLSDEMELEEEDLQTMLQVAGSAPHRSLSL